MKDYVRYGNKNLSDYDIWLANVNQFDGAKKSVETIKIPGRNGTLSIADGSYENITIAYILYTKGDIRRNIAALKAHLNSIDGYARLEDTFTPEHYRLARYINAFTTDSSDRKNAGFTLEFDCDPRMFLKNGDREKTYIKNGRIRNPTSFDALPLIRAYGTGTFTIGGISVEIASADVYTDIDCEVQEAYKGSVNCNNNIALNNGEFPKITPGLNEIMMSGITKLEITPRWWTI